MRERLRAWLGIDGLVADGQLVSRRIEDLAVRDDTLHDRLTASMGEVGKLSIELAELRGQLNAALSAAEPKIEHPTTCPRDVEHTGLVRMATLVEVDSQTGAEKIVGGGYWCPICNTSFYAKAGKKWLSRSEPTQVDEGGAPATTNEPKVKERQLRWRR